MGTRQQFCSDAFHDVNESSSLTIYVVFWDVEIHCVFFWHGEWTTHVGVETMLSWCNAKRICSVLGCWNYDMPTKRTQEHLLANSSWNAWHLLYFSSLQIALACYSESEKTLVCIECYRCILRSEHQNTHRAIKNQSTTSTNCRAILEWKGPWHANQNNFTMELWLVMLSETHNYKWNCPTFTYLDFVFS